MHKTTDPKVQLFDRLCAAAYSIDCVQQHVVAGPRRSPHQKNCTRRVPSVCFAGHLASLFVPAAQRLPAPAKDRLGRTTAHIPQHLPILEAAGQTQPPPTHARTLYTLPAVKSRQDRVPRTHIHTQQCCATEAGGRQPPRCWRPRCSMHLHMHTRKLPASGAAGQRPSINKHAYAQAASTRGSRTKARNAYTMTRPRNPPVSRNSRVTHPSSWVTCELSSSSIRFRTMPRMRALQPQQHTSSRLHASKYWAAAPFRVREWGQEHTRQSSNLC